MRGRVFENDWLIKALVEEGFEQSLGEEQFRE